MKHTVYNEIEDLKKQLKAQQDHIEELQADMNQMKDRIDVGSRKKEEKESRRRKANDGNSDECLHERLEKLITDEQLYLDQNVNLRRVAELLNVTQNRLKQLFANSEDYSNLYRLLCHHRILKACQLIESYPHFSIAAISRECGFVSRKTFYRWFENEMGCTPLDYQKNVVSR